MRTRVVAAIIWFCLALVFVASDARAHGEEKPGPNGGEIRMPGGFHTEVIVETESRVRVFLLDIEFKNPVTKKSSVAATLANAETRTVLACSAEAHSFLCVVPEGMNLKKGTLEVNASREGVPAGPAHYTLPLRDFTGTKSGTGGHKGHHH